MIAVTPVSQVQVEPHDLCRRGWRFWICDACYAPRSLHPRTTGVVARPLGSNYYIAKNAPNFKEGW